ncbi:hypothetical protein GCM10022226_77700 [Sphaerisporangium flaviroseum]|uniref:Uncharacterized protein n=1 Tax=Sphaerisporangium flaviroseum TaxID=509199 RepID=A0ABP7JG26_9ACTN
MTCPIPGVEHLAPPAWHGTSTACPLALARLARIPSWRHDLAKVWAVSGGATVVRAPHVMRRGLFALTFADGGPELLGDSLAISVPCAHVSAIDHASTQEG